MLTSLVPSSTRLLLRPTAYVSTHLRNGLASFSLSLTGTACSFFAPPSLSGEFHLALLSRDMIRIPLYHPPAGQMHQHFVCLFFLSQVYSLFLLPGTFKMLGCCLPHSFFFLCFRQLILYCPLLCPFGGTGFCCFLLMWYCVASGSCVPAYLHLVAVHAA